MTDPQTLLTWLLDSIGGGELISRLASEERTLRRSKIWEGIGGKGTVAFGLELLRANGDVEIDGDKVKRVYKDEPKPAAQKVLF